MTCTIEAANNAILSKLQILQNVAEQLLTHTDKKHMLNSVKILITDYEMGSVKILSNYFLLMETYKNDLKESITGGDIDINFQKDIFNQEKYKLYMSFFSFIKKENIIGKIDRLYFLIKTIIDSCEKKMPAAHINNIKKTISKYKNLTVAADIEMTAYMKCQSCGNNMKIIPMNSELTCICCGNTVPLKGTVFEDEQFYFQEGQRTKHGSYEPLKHGKSWLDCIQARETKTIPLEIIEAVKKCIRCHNIINIDEITCRDVRRYLHQIKHTQYNEHIPLIRKIITGITPPQLTDNETQLVLLIFNKAIKLYEKHKPESKINVMYHPYLFYKIIEHVLNTPRLNRKKRALLKCIHLQSRDTLIENDEIWRKVCFDLSMPYVPTDRNNIDSDCD